ncbi:uncharacterized protein N7518_006593 [Penicillium psychrosexuale]|uniref:uncharacterized protein n=1 Tax=Penicillium psychrosexuale TaxID=1002107 RepID=UPI0025452BC4|nr:uncharacterized protein N7518_006593 [Penicillium psychrosexuale]KAJ5789582.1 hypothetical protein N7518_006593 [Penicillium psychrosexuale]
MTACTNGYLEGSHIRETFAIIEVKAARRSWSARPEVLWQEAAQMVTWIVTDANFRKCLFDRRLLISQDEDDIYLTLAQYPSEYPAYLQGELSPSRRTALPFLTMQEYGLWVIESKKQYASFCYGDYELLPSIHG